MRIVAVVALLVALGSAGFAYEQHRELTTLAKEVADRDSAQGIGQKALWKVIDGFANDLHEIRNRLVKLEGH